MSIKYILAFWDAEEGGVGSYFLFNRMYLHLESQCLGLKTIKRLLMMSTIML